MLPTSDVRNERCPPHHSVTAPARDPESHQLDTMLYMLQMDAGCCGHRNPVLLWAEAKP